jgi:hypothetical protein
MQNNKSDAKVCNNDDGISAEKLNDAVETKQKGKGADADIDKAAESAKKAENFDHGKHDAGAKK